MNLPLHLGFLGALEAGLIAMLVGVLAYALWHWLMRAFGGTVAQTIGWAGVTAVVVAGGLDAWNLFYLGIMKLESPLYARLALQGIHDPGSLGARVVMEVVGAMVGVVIGWRLFSDGFGKENVEKEDRSASNTD